MNTIKVNTSFNFYTIMFIVLTVIAFSPFRNYVQTKTISDILLIGCTGLIMAYYSVLCIRGRLAIRKVNLFSVAFLISIPLMSAMQAHRVFDQPLYLGLLANRSYLLILCSFLIIRFYINRNLTQLSIEKSLIFLCWANLVICLAIVTLLDPGNFDYRSNFVTNPTGANGSDFILPMPFILFGLFYYVSSFISSPTRISFFSFLVFAFYIWFFTPGTGRILSLTVGLILVAIPSFLTTRVIRQIVFMLVIIPLAIVMFQNVSSEGSLYSDGYVAITTVDTVDDPSANIRVVQVIQAIPYITESFWLGNGLLSGKWEGGFEEVFGHFYPTDIGLVGIIFCFGLVGIFVYLYLLVFFFNEYRLFRRNSRNTSIVYVAALCFFGYLVISTIFTASAIFYYEQVAFTLMIIMIFRGPIIDSYNGDKKLHL